MNAPAPATSERLSLQHGLLILLLSAVVMIEGFDIAATSVVLPYLGKDFDAPPAALGNALAVIAAGSIAAWLLIRLADRFGRRPILLLAAAGFSLGSLATAFLAHNVSGYAFLQFVTRALLVTQIAMAYLILSETLPPKLRGRANGLMGAMGSFGAALPFLVIGPAIESPLGWRLIFIIGAAPLLIMPILWWKLRETPVWLASRASGGTPKSQPMAELRRLIQPDLRASFIAMSGLWQYHRGTACGLNRTALDVEYFYGTARRFHNHLLFFHGMAVDRGQLCHVASSARRLERRLHDE